MLDVWLRQGQVAKTGLGGYEIYKPSGGCPAPHVLILITSLVVELHIKLDFRPCLVCGCP